MAVIASFALTVPVYAVSMHPLELPNQHNRQDVRIPLGTEFTITGSGTATNITNASDHRSASFSLLVKVVKDSFGRARLKVESGTLTVGSQTFTVDGGNGIINLHSKRLALHIRVDDGKDRDRALVLYGRVASSSSDGSSFTVDFKSPQSKLAGEWFLQFTGASVTKK